MPDMARKPQLLLAVAVIAEQPEELVSMDPIPIVFDAT
jgi:hypothetical protein